MKDDATLQKVLHAIEVSDRRLAAPKAVGDIDPYDWTIVWKDSAEDGSAKVHFGVVWYDDDYYLEHRETLRGHFHERLFDRLGVEVDDFTVTHYKREQDLVGA
ncbi:hypothetical protein CQ042_00320 [Microbacterium sp. MYb62]|nr:hypothetical protein CQ042_00320 [Microbacterium sp. MYb62]